MLQMYAIGSKLQNTCTLNVISYTKKYKFQK
jgi:hypothetical protein